MNASLQAQTSDPKNVAIALEAAKKAEIQSKVALQTEEDTGNETQPVTKH